MGKESRGAVCLYRSAHRCTLKDASLVSWRFCKKEEVEFLVSNGTQKLYYLKGLKDTWWTRYNDPKIASFPYFHSRRFSQPPSYYFLLSSMQILKKTSVGGQKTSTWPIFRASNKYSPFLYFTMVGIAIVKCWICNMFWKCSGIFFGKVGICFLLLTSPGVF